VRRELLLRGLENAKSHPFGIALPPQDSFRLRQMETRRLLSSNHILVE
jgi:hypothetical protein